MMIALLITIILASDEESSLDKSLPRLLTPPIDSTISLAELGEFARTHYRTLQRSRAHIDVNPSEVCEDYGGYVTINLMADEDSTGVVKLAMCKIPWNTIGGQGVLFLRILQSNSK